MVLVDFDWTPTGRVTETLEAIMAVRKRASQAVLTGDIAAYKLAMCDLHALEVSLVSEAELLIRDIKRVA